MQRLLSFGPVLIFAIASGCNNGLDHDSAMKVMSSALTGTGAAEQHVRTSPATGSLDITVTNPDGSGSAHVVGTATKTPSDISTTFDITFMNWTDSASKITINGALHEAAQFALPLPTSGSAEVSGALSASGAVTGTADFDLKGSYSPTGVTFTGQVGGNSVNLTIGH